MIKLPICEEGSKEANLIKLELEIYVNLLNTINSKIYLDEQEMVINMLKNFYSSTLYLQRLGVTDEKI